ISGGCCGSTRKRTIVGGWAWAWWLVTDVQRLSLEVMTLNPMCEGVETAQGVPLTVTGVAQCKIMKMMNVYYFHHQADELLGTASEQFLGKSVKEIKQTILQTLEGHLRAILGTLTVEEVYKDRDQFAALVREVAAPDVGRMGIEILSFTIKDVYDDVQYLQSLGKAQTASVKRDADAGVAEANRDAGIREAECEKSAMDVKYATDTKIEDNSRMYKLQKANFDQEINTAKAESQLAYELQAAKIRQKIRNEEIQIDVVERRKQIEIEAQEIMRKERELNATVRLPAEAESYRVQMIAEGKRTQTVEVARAEAERIKKIGLAEATAIESVGKAEAERMRMKAGVYKQYGDAAIMNIVLEALPKIAAEVAAPLAKTDEIVLIGGNDSTTGDVTRLVGQLPPAINALTGTLTVEEVYKDRDQFAALVREVAAPDVGRMGIEILSFTIKDVYDDVQYLQSLGKAQTASVKRDADAGVAEANRDAGIREAECEKSAMDVKYATDTKIEDNSRMYKLQKANFDQEINTAIAAEVAAPLAKTDEIVLIGGNDSTTGDVTRLVGQLPPAINALTGVDVSKVFSKIPGAKA
uniref:Band 7 domain-containing protein n=1 Tax=Lutzomyia longipalpis TaxID=7200 RepID=A0A1B0GIG0_LUTLO